MESAVFGLLGVIVGGLITTALTAHWQRKNWHLQELLRAYARLFSAGFREIGMCRSADDAVLSGQDSGIQWAKEMLGPEFESEFLQSTSQCWLLEPDSSLRKRLDQLGEDYRGCRRYLGLQLRKVPAARLSPGEATSALMKDLSTRSAKEVKPEEVGESLSGLRELIGSRYFWRKATTEAPPVQGVSAL